ncbi:MAG: hypothetical protein OEX23_01870 [Betaproteobacteria bacterium]|nr:hypothetical protein [Betaproteobacteria bacterium]
MTSAAPILLADSVTALSAAHAGCVLVAGSHGGVIAARYAAHAQVRAAVFNDAGIGCDEAGVAGLAWLEARGVAAAAVSHDSARIGDAADSLARGRVSRANAQARALGVTPGQGCAHAAQLLRAAVPAAVDEPQPCPSDGRHALRAAGDGAPSVIGLDSIGLVEPGDAGRVLVIGSHGGLHGGDPASALSVDARAAFFHDAGIGRDEAGTTRLPALAARNVPAGTVDFRSARIGDARSMWATGVLSRVNAPLAAFGARSGASLRDVAAALAARG